MINLLVFVHFLGRFLICYHFDYADLKGSHPNIRFGNRKMLCLPASLLVPTDWMLLLLFFDTGQMMISM